MYFVEQRNKPHLLADYLKRTASKRTLVFTRTKHGADKVVKHLSKSGIRAEAIHGNKSQAARERALLSFKSQKPHVLVATDIAARGLDIDDVSHVVNFDLPMVAELYVHRIGRTGRAGASGIAVSFCGRDERSMLRSIERLTRQTLAVEREQPQYPTRDPIDVERTPETEGGAGRPGNGRKPYFGKSKSPGQRPFRDSGSNQAGHGAQGARPSGAKKRRRRTASAAGR